MKKWIDAVGENFKPMKHSVICSDHFISSDYEIRPGAYKPRLKECAVPIIYHNNNDCISSVELSETLLPEMTENHPIIENLQEVHLPLHTCMYYMYIKIIYVTKIF